MAMKRILLILSFLAMSFLQVHAQTRYLVNVLSPVDSYAYRAYKYTGGNSPAMNLAGGLDWHAGFTIGSTLAPYVPGHASFRLGGEYESIMFVLGRMSPCMPTAGR